MSKNNEEKGKMSCPVAVEKTKNSENSENLENSEKLKFSRNLSLAKYERIASSALTASIYLNCHCKHEVHTSLSINRG